MVDYSISRGRRMRAPTVSFFPELAWVTSEGTGTYWVMLGWWTVGTGTKVVKLPWTGAEGTGTSSVVLVTG